MIEDQRSGGVWVAQSVKHLTLDFSPGLDLTILSSSSVLGSALDMKPTFKKKKKKNQKIREVVMRYVV